MKKLLALALAAGAIAAPVASSHGDDRSKAMRVRMVDYLFKGVVAGNASSVSVDIGRARGLTRPARRSLDGATTFTVKLDGKTRIRALHGMRGAQVTLNPGDRVVILIRAPRGTAAAALPAARFILDRAPANGTVTPPPPTPEPVVTPPAPAPPEPGPAPAEQPPLFE